MKPEECRAFVAKAQDCLLPVYWQGFYRDSPHDAVLRKVEEAISALEVVRAEIRALAAASYDALEIAQ